MIRRTHVLFGVVLSMVAIPSCGQVIVEDTESAREAPDATADLDGGGARGEQAGSDGGVARPNDGSIGGSGGSDQGGSGGSAQGGAAGGSGGNAQGGSGGSAQGGAAGGSGGNAQGGSGGAGSCHLAVEVPTCKACVNDKCSNTCMAYESISNHLAYEQCQDQCTTGDISCPWNCTQNYPGAKDKRLSLYQCIVQNCNDECYSTLSSPCITGFPDCNLCSDLACGSECQDFTHAPDLSAWSQCNSQCDTVACYEQCNSSFPSAVSKAGALYTCIHTSCPEECSLSSQCSLATDNTPCDACINEQCLIKCKKSANAKDSNAYLSCANACQDQSCFDQCAKTFPNGSKKFAALTSCISTRCKSKCQ